MAIINVTNVLGILVLMLLVTIAANIKCYLTTSEKNATFTNSNPLKRCSSSNSDIDNSQTEVFCQDIENRIKEIKYYLDRVSTLYDSDIHDKCTSEDNENASIFKTVTEDDEDNADRWDLLAFPKKHCRDTNNHQYECGDFFIDEDLHVFRQKVIRKANIIISCFKKKLDECNKDKSELNLVLEKYNNQKSSLEGRLSSLHKQLKKCEENNERIINKVAKYQEELTQLLKEEQSSEVSTENIHQLNVRKERVIKQMEHLCHLSETCQNDKSHLLNIGDKLEERLIRCKNKIEELKYLINELQKELDKLIVKIDLLDKQNEDLKQENNDLEKIGKALTNLRNLCCKYRKLKRSTPKNTS